MSRQELTPGAAATLTYVVRDTDLASALSLEPGETFPAVFATSRMVALMELAAARLLRPLLGDGELSVGVTVDITHSAATPPGGTVTATGTFVRMEGKLYVFEVVATDDARIAEAVARFGGTAGSLPLRSGWPAARNRALEQRRLCAARPRVCRSSE